MIFFGILVGSFLHVNNKYKRYVEEIKKISYVDENIKEAREINKNNDDNLLLDENAIN